MGAAGAPVVMGVTAGVDDDCMTDGLAEVARMRLSGYRTGEKEKIAHGIMGR